MKCFDVSNLSYVGFIAGKALLNPRLSETASATGVCFSYIFLQVILEDVVFSLSQGSRMDRSCE